MPGRIASISRCAAADTRRTSPFATAPIGGSSSTTPTTSRDAPPSTEPRAQRKDPVFFPLEVPMRSIVMLLAIGTVGVLICASAPQGNAATTDAAYITQALSAAPPAVGAGAAVVRM